MLIDYAALFVNLIVLFAYIGLIFVAVVCLIALVGVVGYVALDWNERNTSEQRARMDAVDLSQVPDASALVTFLCYLVAALQGRSDTPKPTYIVNRLLQFAEQYPSQRQQLVREAIRTAKHAGLGAEAIIDHADPTLLRGTLMTMRDELQDWGADGGRLADYMLQEHEVH